MQSTHFLPREETGAQSLILNGGLASKTIIQQDARRLLTSLTELAGARKSANSPPFFLASPLHKPVILMQRIS
jgi:hypothetical protein